MRNNRVSKRVVLATFAIVAVAIVTVGVFLVLADKPLNTSTTSVVSQQSPSIETVNITRPVAINNTIKQNISPKAVDPLSEALVDALKLDKKNQFTSVRTNEDQAGNIHARYKQIYEGIPVWGAEVIIHADHNGNIKKITGKQVSGLENKLTAGDLQNPSVSSTQALNAAKQKANDFMQAQNISQLQYRNEKTDMVIYVDEADKAHVAYHVDYVVETAEGNPARPNFMIDVQTGNVLKQWDGLATLLVGTGPGGNSKIGQHEFGLGGFYGYLDVTPSGSNCTMTDQFNYLKSVDLGGTTTASTTPYVYVCYRNTYRTINSGYSPINDGHYYGRKTVDMYQSWLGVSPRPGSLFIRTGYGISVQGAFWDGTAANFGDGASSWYPLPSAADVVAHEVSHAFTEYNSALLTVDEPGAVNESFSDMAGEALEYYWKGTNDWLLGADVVKSGTAIRYLQNPKLDGQSITHKTQYITGSFKQHYNGGVFNRAFYLVATSSGWNTQKAFTVFAEANQNYWTVLSDFVDASCGVLNATLDEGYDPDPVRLAFQSVGVFCPDTSIILDTDSDLMTDTWELSNGLNKNSNDAAADADSDTFSNLQEYTAGSDPNNNLSVPVQTSFRESFEAATLPVDWKTTFGSDTAWVPVNSVSFATHGSYGLSSKPLAGKYSHVEFTSYFVTGTSLTFDYLLKQGASDSFDIYIDGVLNTSVTGSFAGTQWVNKNIALTSGKHTVLFQFKRSSASPSGSAAYIDNVQYLRLEADTDGDGNADSIDTDDDNDGLLDTVEVQNGTDRLNADTDGDGYLDGSDAYPTNATLTAIFGTAAGANVGNAVAVADVNADGYDDVVVGSFRSDPINSITLSAMKDAGMVKVYSGINLSLLYTWYGEKATDNFGSSVANAGDVNNDGKADIIVGATGYDPINPSTLSVMTNAGAAYVYSGADGSLLYKITGEKAGDNFGVAVSGGDCNTDGKSDLIIGANRGDLISGSATLADAGRVYVYSGANGTTILHQFSGDTASDNFGSSVASGDINNDGKADIVVGAPNDEVNPLIQNNGTVFVYSGATGSLLTSKSGEIASDGFGTSVASGDTNNDAYDDIVVGAPKYDVISSTIFKDVGAAYVYSGSGYAQLYKKVGVAAGDAFGSVVSAGDVNNDSKADIVVGVCKSDYTSKIKDAGSVNVYSGATGANVVTGAALTGTLKSQWFGCAVAAGDINNDGFADVIVGSQNAAPAGIKAAGSVHIYSGNGL